MTGTRTFLMMHTTGRRAFLGRLGAAALALPALAASRPPAQPAYGLLIAGGRVIDPSQGLSAVRDVAIAGGRIAALEPAIPRERARQVLDARGRIVTPGLIDLHGHVYDRGITISVDPDLVGVARGVTTIVDGGSTGATTFAGFRQYVIERAETSVFALLNIAAIGLVVTNELFLDPRIVDPEAAVRVIEENRDRILGVKVRVRGHREGLEADLEALRRAREAADAVRLPLMMHWSNEPELLDLLRPGDIVTHPFNPPRAGPSLLDERGRVLPQIRALGERGIVTDFAHGGHLQWDIAERAAADGWFPDIISTDIHRRHLAPDGAVVDLATTLAKFMHLGLSLEQVIERVTARPAGALGFPEPIGTLRPGTMADVSVLDVTNEPIELVDSNGDVRTGARQLTPVATVKSGRLVMTQGIDIG